jgi:hypothetical protein
VVRILAVVKYRQWLDRKYVARTQWGGDIQFTVNCPVTSPDDLAAILASFSEGSKLTRKEVSTPRRFAFDVLAASSTG